ncbi:MAG: hypothetical protein ABIR51_06705 [Sphingomicrobium sp.]
MSHSLRFLGLAVAAWAGIRAVSLGLVPGAEALAFDRLGPASAAVLEAPQLPPVEPTDLSPPEPIQPAYGSFSDPAYPPAFAYPTTYYPGQPISDPRPRQAGRSAAPRYAELTDVPGLPYYSQPVPALDEWPLSRIASGGRVRRMADPASSVAAARFDRLQLTSWAMLRGRPGAASLASNGMLGGSQAGARLLYRFDRHFAASLRATAPIGSVTRGGELAAGVRFQPFASIPIALTAERRQAFGRGAGRSAFALFAEGGVWDQPVVAGFALDAYLQGGMVGARHRALFVDGSATLTRPLWRNFSGGVGLWGGAQPGLTRLDVGPRLSLKVGRSMRAHLDYRYEALGNAAPASGPVVTLAADF